MTQYMWAEGHDVALESLIPFDPQPRTQGIQATRRTYLPDGTVQDDGEYVEFEFDYFETEAKYRAQLANGGLDDATAAAVTVYVKNTLYNWVRMNGTAVRPLPGESVQRRQYMLHNIKILVRDLEVAS